MPWIKAHLGLTNYLFWESPGRTEWRASFCPASSTCHSGVVSACWWTHLKRQTDYKPTAGNWALSIQENCVQQYWCLSMFQRVCLLGSTKPNYQKQLRKRLCSDIFPVTWLMVKTVLSLGMKKESITAYCKQKYSSGLASYPGKKFKATPSAVKVMAIVFFGGRTSDFRNYATWSND